MSSDVLELASRFVAAIEEGDVEAARACLTPDAGIWHNFDDVTQSVDDNMKVLEWMKRNARSRHYEVRRVVPLEDGFLQQHVLRFETANGEHIAAHACVVATVKDGLITRIEEYLDPAPLVRLG